MNTLRSARLPSLSLPGLLAGLLAMAIPARTPLAAQNGPVTVSFGVSQLWSGAVYRGEILFPPLSLYPNGSVTIDPLTLTTLRGEVYPHGWPFGLYLGAGVGSTWLDAEGSSSAGSIHIRSAYAHVLMLSLGALRNVSLGRGLPTLDVGLGLTLFRLNCPPGILVRQYLSPGPELPLSLLYPAGERHFQLELRTTLALVDHHTEGLDGNWTTSPSGPDFRWTPVATLGAGFHFVF